jgi:c(7)-type cytochrome triheme protein
MRGLPVAALVLASALGMMLLVGAPGHGAVTAPPDFRLEAGEGSPGPVTFSHARHLARVERCTTCHARTFKMHRGATGPMTMEAMQQGKLCGACHDGRKRIGEAVVFSLDDCARCHAS